MLAAVIHNLPPGGARRRLEQQLRWLPFDVVEVCPTTATPVRPGAHTVPLAPRAPRVRRPLRPPLRYLDLASVVRAWDEVADIVNALRPDAVFANPCRIAKAPLALRRLRAPSLYFCDEPRRVDHDAGGNASRRRLTRPIYCPLHTAERHLDAAAVAAADRLVTNSRYTAACIDAAYGRAASVVPMGAPESFRPPETPSERVNLLSVGTLLEEKGHELVLRAAALAMRRRPVVIVAPRPHQPEHARLERLAAELRVDLEVRVGISDAALVTEYHRAHATLYLAKGEPFGLASLEAQACGSPVLVSDEGGLPETLVQGSGWALPRDAARVAQAIDRLENPELHRATVRRAIAHGAEATWQRSSEAIGAMLAELAANGGR